MPIYYYDESKEYIENYIGGGEETLIEAYERIKNKKFKKKVKNYLNKCKINLN